jgi:hypothetical protein
MHCNNNGNYSILRQEILATWMSFKHEFSNMDEFHTHYGQWENLDSRIHLQHHYVYNTDDLEWKAIWTGYILEASDCWDYSTGLTTKQNEAIYCSTINILYLIYKVLIIWLCIFHQTGHLKRVNFNICKSKLGKEKYT